MGEIKMVKDLPKCRKCNMTLKWPEWTGKPQRPVEPNGLPHDCPMFGGNDSYKGGKWVNLKKEDLEICVYCGNWFLTEKSHEKYPNVHYTSKADHIKVYHPNNELLDVVDFMIVDEVYKEELRIKYNLTKRTELYKS